jgi:LuxR family maltose regulon positive regulatory protein
VLLHQGDLEAAAHLAQIHDLPFSQARVFLARGDAPGALAVLEPLRQQMEAKGWADELLKVRVLQAIALHVHGEKNKAVQLLSDILALAKPGGYVRLFVDEGEPMRLLISDFRLQIEKRPRQSVEEDMQQMKAYSAQLLAAFSKALNALVPKSTNPNLLVPDSLQGKSEFLPEPLSGRELEVLKLLRSELSGPEIAQQLIVSLNTLRTHTNNIYNKLGVNNRRAAVRRAEELTLL